MHPSQAEYNYWQRSVYVVQCATSRVATSLGLTPKIGYRALPGYRDKFAQAARDMIALSVRMSRFSRSQLAR